MTAVSITVGITLSHVFLAPITQYFFPANSFATLSPWRRFFRDISSVDINVTVDRTGSSFFCYHAPLDFQELSILNYVMLETFRDHSQIMDHSLDSNQSQDSVSHASSESYIHNLEVRIDTVTPFKVLPQTDSLTPDSSIASFSKGLSLSPDQNETPVFWPQLSRSPPLLAPNVIRSQDFPESLRDKMNDDSPTYRGKSPKGKDFSVRFELPKEPTKSAHPKHILDAVPRDTVTPSPKLWKFSDSNREQVTQKSQLGNPKKSESKTQSHAAADGEGMRMRDESQSKETEVVIKGEKSTDVFLGEDSDSHESVTPRTVPSTPMWEDFLHNLNTTRPHPTVTSESSALSRKSLSSSSSLLASPPLTASSSRVAKKSYLQLGGGDDLKKSLLENEEEEEDYAEGVTQVQEKKDENATQGRQDAERKKANVSPDFSRSHVTPSEARHTNRQKRTLGHLDHSKSDHVTSSQSGNPPRSPTEMKVPHSPGEN